MGTQCVSVQPADDNLDQDGATTDSDATIICDEEGDGVKKSHGTASETIKRETDPRASRLPGRPIYDCRCISCLDR